MAEHYFSQNGLTACCTGWLVGPAITGLWVPNLLAAMAVYAPIEKSLHLEEQIHAKQELR